MWKRRRNILSRLGIPEWGTVLRGLDGDRSIFDRSALAAANIPQLSYTRFQDQLDLFFGNSVSWRRVFCVLLDEENVPQFRPRSRQESIAPHTRPVKTKKGSAIYQIANPISAY